MPDANASIDPVVQNIAAENAQIRVEGQQQALSGAAASGDASKMTFSSLGELQAKYPEFARLLMESMAQQMCRKSQRDSDRLVQQMREERYRSGG